MSDGFRRDLAARFGSTLHFFESIGSTQEEALAAAGGGAPEGSLFVAEQQTAGRGRHGHVWISPPGAGIYASLLLRPRRPVNKLLWLTLAAGLGVADAVQRICGLEPEVRWPNDLLLEGKKFCGLLIEAEGGTAALGFGINTRQTAFPPDLAGIATFLPCERSALCIAAVESLLQRYADWRGGDDEAIREEFERRSGYARGLAVTVDAAWSGVTEGLDGDGFLRVRTPDGSIRTVVSGNVRPASATDN